MLGCAYIFAETVYQKLQLQIVSFLDKCGFISGVLSEDIVVLIL